METVKDYGVVTMQERGQIVVPKDIRVKLKLKKNDKIFLIQDKNAIVLQKLTPKHYDKFLSAIKSL